MGHRDALPFMRETGKRLVSNFVSAFDIFKQQLDGIAYWIEAAQDLETAKARVRVLAEAFPGHYVIVDNTTGEKISIRSIPS